MPLDLDRTDREHPFVENARLPSAEGGQRPGDGLGVGNASVADGSRAGLLPAGVGAGTVAGALAQGVVAPAIARVTSLAGPFVEGIGEAWSRVRPRLGLKSLYWRILIVNLSGLAIMLLGTIWLSAQQDWLIEAKRESIHSQAQVIVDAIVREATSDERGFSFPNPDRLLDRDQGPTVDLRPYDVQELEFAIQPERVAPILQRYSQASGQRARIYARDGTLIYDSAGLSSRVSRRDLPPLGQSEDPAIQSMWTRLDSLFMPSNLPVYREIGRANGRAYPEVAAALSGQSMPMLMVNDRGSHMVSVAVPIQRMKAVQGALLLSTREGDIDGIRRKERHLFTWIFVIASIATAMTALALAGTIARPMRKLSEAALAVKGNINAAKDLPSFPDHKDEIGQLASAFRDMTGALYKRIELSEKFAADVAHELKNPVAAVSSATQLLTSIKKEEDRNELLQIIQTDLNRLDKLITDIWSLSRLDADISLHEARPIDLSAMAKGMASTFNARQGARTGAKGRPATVLVETAAARPGLAAVPYIVNGHESRIGQVLTNLIDNALSFSPPDGQVTVRLRSSDGQIEVQVDDEGPGIPEEHFEKIFERFYTDRPDSEATQGKNSGLGLSITREIVEAHAGTIRAENRADYDGVSVRGARFVVTLPAARAATEPRMGWRH